MKALVATAAAAVLAVSGCSTPVGSSSAQPRASSTASSVEAPIEGAASATASPSASPDALSWRDIPVAPKKASAFEVILSDEALLVLDADEPYGPYMFAVFGNQVLLDDPGDNDVLTYTDGHRTGAAAIDSPEHYVEDLLQHGEELYVLQGDGDTGTHRTVQVYDRDSSGRKLTPVRILPGELVAGNAQASIHFSGPTLVGEAWGDEPVLLDGPGPLAEPTLDVADKVFTVELPGSQPLRIHTRYAPDSIDLILLDDDYAYYLAVDFDADSDSGDVGMHVYRVALSATGTDATYTLADSPSYEPSRQVQVVGGQVYQLRATDKAVEVLRLHPNP